MVCCAIAWIWLGFAEPLGRIDGDVSGRWSVVGLLSDSQFGLTIVPIIAGSIGYFAWRWGSRAPQE